MKPVKSICFFPEYFFDLRYFIYKMKQEPVDYSVPACERCFCVKIIFSCKVFFLNSEDKVTGVRTPKLSRMLNVKFAIITPRSRLW